MNSIGLKLIILLSFIFTSCDDPNEAKKERPDPHSFSRPQEAVTTHLDLQLICDFDKKILHGIASWDITNHQSERIIFDMMDLVIDSVMIVQNDGNRSSTDFYVENRDSILGDELTVKIKKNTNKVILYYSTTPDALALQWLDADLTLSKKQACLFTQSQSIYARSWIPCQDGPAIRFTYNASIQVPSGMIALMSASNPTEKNKEGKYQFKMEHPVPAYLMALAVGDFHYAPIGARTGVYADSLLLKSAAWEFADLEKMVEAAESLYGPYTGSRYDVIVLPTGFPFGGMENPRLTFLTPTVIAGDRSLTSLLAHELAHSWSGNLVTNATWQDFWLNEGFTTYFESRIMEKIYGKEYADMLSLLGFQDLQKTLNDMEPELTKLKLDLWYKDPELSLSDIAYEKGKLLLRYLEERLGREEWDRFLNNYFKNFAFKSNDTEGFVQFFNSHFPTASKEIQDTIQLFIYQPGLPLFKPSWSTILFDKVDSVRNNFIQSQVLKKSNTQNWSTHEWLHFIRSLDSKEAKWLIPNLESEFKLSEIQNAEIAFVWYIYLIKSGYADIFRKPIDGYLERVGRRKLILPLFEELIQNNQANWAKESFTKFRKYYHPITIQSIEKALQIQK
ncbi:MAG: M1 family metallopeptidase [Saprospiraceae bacterium]|nr:M1 family metallopeptidase [Saprospiraceae bacterium]